MYEAGVRSDPEPTRPRRATTAAVLLGVFGLLGILSALLLRSVVGDSVDHGQSVPAVLYVLVYAQFALSATQAICGVFVWQGRSWARVVAIVLCSVNIVGAVVSLFTGAVLQTIAGLALNIGLLRLLNNDDVREWCVK